MSGRQMRRRVVEPAVAPVVTPGPGDAVPVRSGGPAPLPPSPVPEPESGAVAGRPAPGGRAGLLGAAALALALRGIGVAAQAAGFVIVARNLSLEAAGLWSLLAGMLLLGRYLGPLGLDQLALRRLAREPGEARAILRAARWPALALLLAGLVAEGLTLAPAAAPGVTPVAVPRAVPSGNPGAAPGATVAAGPFASPAVTPLVPPAGGPPAAPGGDPVASPARDPSAVPARDPSAVPAGAGLPVAGVAGEPAVVWAGDRSGFLLLGGAIAALMALSGTAAGVQRGLGRVFGAYAAEAVVVPVAGLAGLAGLAAGGALTALSGGLALLGAAALGLLIQAWQSRGLPARATAPGAGRLLAEALPLWLVQGANVAQNRGALWLGFALLGPAAAALLEAGLRVALLPSLATWAVAAVFGPRIAAAQATGDGAGLRGLLRLGGLMAFLPACGCLGLVALAGGPGFALVFGPGFAAAVPAALILLLAQAVNAAGSLASTALMMAGRERLVLAATVLAALVLAGVAALAAPGLGPAGVALGVLAATVLRDGGLVLLLRLPRRRV